MKPKSQYTLRMEEYQLIKIPSDQFSHHYANLNNSASNSRKKKTKSLSEA